MNIEIFNYRSAIQIIDDKMLNVIQNSFQEVDFELKRNSVSRIRKKITTDLICDGWVQDYIVDISSRISIFGFKEEIGMCFQTGNVSRVYADLLKLQTLFTKGKIRAGILLVPTNETAKKLSSNMANYERVLTELPIFSQVITMPIAVIGFYK